MPEPDRVLLVLVGLMGWAYHETCWGSEACGKLCDEGEEIIRAAGYEIEWGLGPGMEKLVPSAHHSKTDA